jgi:hydrogenase maturation protease
MKAPLLVLGWGNPSRGDDALGPLLCDRLESAWHAGSTYEVLQDFQLQVEDAFDIEGRELVVFIDASASGAAPYSFRPVEPCEDRTAGSHALSPESVLYTTSKILGSTPPAFVLAVRGENFELGAPLSDGAGIHLEAAWALLSDIAAASDALAECRRKTTDNSISDRPAPESSSA